MNIASGENVLAATAQWTAAARGRESTRGDALLRDPWAAALAGDAGRAWLAGRAAGSTTPIILRTRYFDDYLTQAAATGIRQMVLLAAGLDTRAYRLPWPAGVIFYEVDQPSVLAEKAKQLTAMQSRMFTDAPFSWA